MDEEDRAFVKLSRIFSGLSPEQRSRLAVYMYDRYGEPAVIDLDGFAEVTSSAADEKAAWREAASMKGQPS